MGDNEEPPRHGWARIVELGPAWIGAIAALIVALAGAGFFAGRVTKPIVTPTPTVTVTVTSTGTSVIRITSPRTGNIVHAGAIGVEGTTTQPLVTGHEIWIVVQPLGTGRYYPQWPPAAVAATGGWTAATVALGSIDTFLIYAVDADRSVIDAFHAYLQQNPHSSPGMVSLPPAAQIADKVTITRQ